MPAAGRAQLGGYRVPKGRGDTGINMTPFLPQSTRPRVLSVLAKWESPASPTHNPHGYITGSERSCNENKSR